MDTQHTPIPATARRRPGRLVVAGLLIAAGAFGAATGTASAGPGPSIPAVDPVVGGRPTPSVPAREVRTGPTVSIPTGPASIELRDDVTPIRPPAGGLRVEVDQDRVRDGLVSDQDDLTDPDRFRFDEDAFDRELGDLGDVVVDVDGDDGVEEAVEEEYVDDAAETTPPVVGEEVTPETTGDPVDGATDTATDTTADTTPDTTVGVDGAEETASADDADRAGALAFTGSSAFLPLLALGLLVVGSLVAALATVARRSRA